MLTERTIINALIITASFILVPFMISESLTAGDFLPAFALLGIVVVIVAFFFIKEKLSACPMLGSFVAGTLNFLPIPLGAGHIASLLLILYYVTGFIIIRQRKIKLGRTLFLWPIALVVGIVIFHNHSLSLGSLGGSTEGARPAFFIYLYALAYFCGINLPSPSVEFLGRIPYYAVLLTFLSSIPYLMSTYIPALAPYFYSVTSSVNVEAYVNTQGGTQDVGGFISTKLAAFGPMGAALQLYLICHYPMGTWFSPKRLGVLLLSMMCIVLTICCGYRSDLFSFTFMTLMGAWAYYSWRSLIIPIVGVVGMLILITASSNNLISVPLSSLPMIAQRTMSFLPGDWDQDAIDSGKSSNEFRQNIQDVYVDEYMMKSPWFGNGFDIDKEEFEAIEATLDAGSGAQAPYYQAKLYVEGKMFHTGWMAVYDNVGLIGSIGFLAMQISIIIAASHFVFGPRADRRSSLYPLYVWMFANSTSSIVSFYTVFGSFPDAVNGMLANAVILSHLFDLEAATEPPVIPGQRAKQTEFTGLSSPNYGYGGSRYGK